MICEFLEGVDQGHLGYSDMWPLAEPLPQPLKTMSIRGDRSGSERQPSHSHLRSLFTGRVPKMALGTAPERGCLGPQFIMTSPAAPL